MATKLFLRDAATTGIGTFRDLRTTAGGGVTTGIVNTVASGTEIQWTKTAGGAVLAWISGRVPSGGFTLAGTMTFNVWAVESNTAANVGGRSRVFKRTAAGVESAAGGPYNDGVEMATNAAYNWTGAPTSTAFAENDRIIVRYYITNVGVMGGSRTATLNYDGPTGAASGDSWFQIIENVAFKTEERSGTLTGTLDALTGAATATADVTAAAAVTLEAVALAGTGMVAAPATEGTLDVALDALALTATATADVTGTTGATLADLTAITTGTTAVSGTTAQTLEALTGTATGTTAIAGTLARTLDPLTGTGTATMPATASLAATLDLLTLTGTGTTASVIDGTLAETLALLTLVASGTVGTAPAATRFSPFHLWSDGA